MDEQWFSTAAVADRLGVSAKTVKAWIRAGTLDAWNIGGRVGYRIRQSAIERFLADQGRHHRTSWDVAQSGAMETPGQD